MYSITIETSSEDNSGTDSGVFMTIYGEKNRTKQVQLNTTKQGDDALFEQSKTNEFELELDDVGNVY
jgi:secreted protein with Ig-like and vWFA domain